MRLEFSPAGPGEPVWPDGVRGRAFESGDARPLHSLLAHGYRRGGGSVAAFEPWFTQMTTDEEFDPKLWFLAESRAMLIGAVLCWTSAFVKDVVVHESWRRRGVAEALLLYAFHALWDRGAMAVELKVEGGNRNAVRLYERLGMQVMERLDRT
jgi:ribosomal protein S18 acetylase RimI-like enzyme